MQRHIVADCVYPTGVYPPQKIGPHIGVGNQNKEDVSIVSMLSGRMRASQQTQLLDGREPFLIAVPKLAPMLRDRLPILQLRPQKRRYEFAGQERRSDVDPGVFFDFAAIKPQADWCLSATAPQRVRPAPDRSRSGHRPRLR